MELESSEGLGRYDPGDFIPLAAVFALAILGSVLATTFLNLDVQGSMMAFMGVLLLELGGLKAYNIDGFVSAYRTYDLVAARSKLYARVYPFIELSLGSAYLGMALVAISPAVFVLTNVVTVAVMLVGAAGVFNELRKGEKVRCACLGDVFHVPMTWVTLFEDLLMAGMAAAMLAGLW